MPGLAFLNPLLLWGLALGALPILLHLLQRRRYRVRRWAAMEFLQSSLRHSSRRLRIEQWLLLLVRALILMVAALALARPVWHSPRWAWLGSRAAAQVLVVLDDSYSMGWRDTETRHPTPRFAWAQERALELIRRALSAGDTISVVLASEPARPLIRRPTYNLGEAARQVRGTTLSDRRTDLLGAARLCGEILRSSRAPTREVYLLTDLQAVAWRSPDVAAAWRRVAAAAVLHLVALPAARDQNLAVTEVRAAEIAVPGRPMPVTVRVTNTGVRAVPRVVVTLHADGRAVASSSADIPAEGATVVRFEHTFTSPGSHTLMVELPPDGLPVDDRGYASVLVRARTRVLILNGHPDPDPRRDAAFFLNAALAPGGSPSPDAPALEAGASDPFETKVIEGESFGGADLSHWDVVILADVPRLADGDRRALAGFVAEGGGLLLLPGASVQPAFYNGDLLARAPSLMPARLGPVREAGSLTPALDLSRVDHPALTRFRDAADVDLSTARFERYHLLGELPQSTGARVICRFTSSGGVPPSPAGEKVATPPGERPSQARGAAALVERSVGLGRVLLFASPPAAGWNTLPFKPAFLPLLHGLVTYLGQGPGGSRNLRVGDPLVAVVPEAAARTAGASPKLPDPWRLEGPGGNGMTLRSAPAAAGVRVNRVLSIDTVPRAGFYQLRREREGLPAHGSQPAVTSGAGPPAAIFAANLRTDESDLRALSRGQVEKLLAPAAVRWVDPHESLVDVVREGRQGREAWRGLLFGALALMLLESGMAQVFGRRRRATG